MKPAAGRKLAAGVLRTLLDLFVDDAALVVLALLWLVATAWLLPMLVGAGLRGALLFAGLAAILGYSVGRA